MSIFESKKILNDAFRNNESLKEISGSTLKKLQATELEMFINLNKICVNNNINLILGGGTLLGAIRHKGFIPWDDDIDLNLHRKYVKDFIYLVNKEYSNIYTVQYMNENQARQFIKIRNNNTVLDEIDAVKRGEGVSVDIFIIEDIPDNYIRRLIYGFICTVKLYIASCLSYYENKNHEFITAVKRNRKALINYYIKMIIGFVFSYDKYYERAIKNDNYLSKYLNNGTKYVSIPTGRKHFFGEIYNKELFEDLETTSFEGIKCLIPKKYDLYLTNLYGKNYMKIPPKNKREHHYVLDVKL